MIRKRPPSSRRGRGDYYNYQCDRCGFKYSSESQREEWTGLQVCTWCFDEKHPQLEPWLYTHPETSRPANPSPLIVIPAASCSVYGGSAIADQCQADCAVADQVSKFKVI